MAVAPYRLWRARRTASRADTSHSQHKREVNNPKLRAKKPAGERLLPGDHSPAVSQPLGQRSARPEQWLFHCSADH